jgi:hypothetical protein
MLGRAESSGASVTQRVPKTHPAFGPRWQLLAFLRHVCFSNRPFGVKHFQTIHPCGDGREQTFRIVREDEADPAHGTVSYVSPVARAVMTLGRETRSRLQAARQSYWTCGRSRHCLTAGRLRCRMLRKGAPERQARGEFGRRLRRRGSRGPRADAFKTQREAIDWARKNNHSPLVARVRHLNDKKIPGHWRAA